jgi:exonuclease SbcC
MKILHFKKLKLTNFLSVGANPLELQFQEGLNLITGYNKDVPEEKNGIGKSSICDGLFFALFNETIKNLKMGEIVNDKIKKKCEVELEFSIDYGTHHDHYKITRKLKPSDCKLEINGRTDKTLSSIPLTNKKIQEVLGVSKQLFKQAIVMSIGKSSSFFSQGKTEKRKFIEGIFNLEIFSDMLADARTGYNDTRKEKDILQTQLGNEKSRLDDYKQRDNDYEDSKESLINEWKDQIRENLEKIKELQGQIKEVQDSDELLAKLEDITGRLDQIDKLNVKIEVELSETNKSISDLNDAIENASEVCYACDRRYDDAEEIARVKAKRKDEVSKLNETRIILASKKNKIVEKKKERTKERDEVRVMLASVKSISDSNKTITSHIQTLRNSCENIKGKILEKRQEVSSFADLIEKTIETISTLDAEYKEVFKAHKVYDICKFVLSEEGVKSIIIKRLKNLLNQRLNSYLDDLGSPVTCEFDEYFTETIYNKNGVEKSYDAFSGGESKRIDLAILLTFQDILKEQSGLDIKLGFYDEILDSSIDESGRKKVLRILKDKSEHTPTYIISHRGKMSDLIDREIVLEKRNDFTFIKEIK